MNNNHAASTVQVQADAGSLLNALRATFSNSTTVLSELLQNARRAGASKVDITVTDELLVFQDDGCGIDDFSVLLSIAKSGWDTAVQRNDAPYGLGWLSTLFACEHVGVMSHGRHLYAATEDLLAVKPVPVNESADLGVTEIRLHQHRLGAAGNLVAYTLPALVRGFPIPVFVNGRELERPHAMDQLETVEIAVGHACNQVLAGRDVKHVYLQGLPIDAGVRSGHIFVGGVLHLASPRFKGRMPDREQILDRTANASLIRHGINQEIRSRLAEVNEVMEPTDFLLQYGDLAVSQRLFAMVNAVPYAPSNWFDGAEDYPSLEESEYGFVGFANASDLVSREQLNGAGIYRADDLLDDQYRLLARLWVHATGGYLVPEQAPSWHWLYGDAKVISDDHIRVIPGEVIGTDDIDDGWDRLEVKVVDSLHVQCAVGDDVQEAVSIDTCYDPETRALYVLSSKDWNQSSFHDLIGRAAAQVFEQGDDSDDITDERRDRLITSLSMVVLAIESKDPEGLMTSLLSTIPGVTPKQLHGRQFVVSVDEAGAMSVSAA